MGKKKHLISITIGIMLMICCFSRQVYATDEPESNQATQISETELPSVTYSTHVQDIGWQKNVKDGKMSGTSGKSLRLETIKIELEKIGIDIKYQVHIQNIGWQDWKKNGETAGTTGQSLRLEAIKILLDSEEYSVMYRTHIQDIGWQNWRCDGEIAGTSGQGLRLEGIEIKIVEKRNEQHIKYRSHIQDIGWQDNVVDGETSGTSGKGLKLEAIQINLVNFPENAKVKYRAYVQNSGWQDWKYDGSIAGTSKQGLRLEAIQIKLENLDEYTVEYRAHIQDIGWTNWSIDGKTAGAIGTNKRLEAIQIRIVPSYQKYYTGIDVSYWQGKIDYDKLSKDSQVDFMIARIGWYSHSQGKLVVDSQFQNNYKGAKSKNIPLGAYVYSYATSVEGAKKEAEAVVEYLKSTGQTNYEMPIFYDLEDDSQISLGKETLSKMAIAFGEVLQKAGYNVGLYSYSYWLDTYMNMSMIPESYSLWVANYGSNNNGQLPEDVYKYSETHDIWQYTDKGVIDGIDGYVDMNIAY